MEILVALVIFSVMAAGFSHYVGDQARRLDTLTSKTLSAIIAGNVLTEIQLSGGWPQTGDTTKQVTMAGRNWQIHLHVQDTDYPSLRRLDVEVSPAGGEENIAATMVGFAGKH